MKSDRGYGHGAREDDRGRDWMPSIPRKAERRARAHTHTPAVAGEEYAALGRVRLACEFKVHI